MKCWRICSIQFLVCAIGLGSFSTVFAGSDIENGKHINQEKCNDCHAQKSSFGSGDMLYTRTDSKVSSYSRLKSMVSRCNSELRLDLFPEDEVDVAAYLNAHFYKFKP
jgi:cytochrome c